jgi:mannitol-specific phosphotransferase system IIBC component
LTPRFAVGSVNTAEVAVATVSAGTIIASLGADSVELGVVVAMLLGGVLAAPLAAFVVRYMPARAIGLAVGALLLVTNARDLAGFAELGALRWLAYAAVVALVALAILTPQLDARRARIEPGDDGPVAL